MREIFLPLYLFNEIEKLRKNIVYRNNPGIYKRYAYLSDTYGRRIGFE
jgi:hypothetical protein